MSDEMPETKAPPPLNKDELVASCSFCHAVFDVRYQDRDGAVHDLATGDLVCCKCDGKSGNSSTYLDCLNARDVPSAPFFIKREARLGSSRPQQGMQFSQTQGGMTNRVIPESPRSQPTPPERKDGMADLDKCPEHLDAVYVAVDMHKLRMACINCIKECQHRDYASFTEAHSIFSKRIVVALTTPFFSKNTAHASSSNVLGDDGKDDVMFAVLREMNPVVNQLSLFVSELRSVTSLVDNQLSQLLQLEHPNTSMGIDWRGLAKDVTAFMDSIGDAFDMGAQSITRTLQRIHGTVLEAMAIVGLEGVNVEEMGNKVLSSRPVTPTTVAEIVLVVRTLESLKGTLQQGDIGGLSQLNLKNLDKFLTLSEVLSRSSLDPIRSACTPLSELNQENDLHGELLLGHLTRLFEAIIGLDNKYFEIFTCPTPRQGLKNLLRWKIELTSKLNREGLFQEALNALMYDDIRPTYILTHHIMDIIKHIESTGDPNVFLLKALLKYNGVEGSNFMFFKYAQDKGCTHPLLYYFLGNCYLADPNQSNRDKQKALECFHMTIEGGYPIGYEGISRLHDTEKYGKGFVYLEGLVSEGYTYGDILCATGLRSKGSLRGVPRTLEYFEQAAEKGCNTVYQQIHNLYRYGATYELISQSSKAWTTLIEAHKQGVNDIHILEILVDGIRTSNYRLTKQDLVLAGFKDEATMILHYCDLLIQKHSPYGYRTKSHVYSYHIYGGPSSETKSLRILEEAAELGLLNYPCYKKHLISKYKTWPSSDNKKAITYLKKCLEIAPDADTRVDIYKALASRHEDDDEKKANFYYWKANKEKKKGEDGDFIFLFGNKDKKKQQYPS